MQVLWPSGLPAEASALRSRAFHSAGSAAHLQRLCWPASSRATAQITVRQVWCVPGAVSRRWPCTIAATCLLLPAESSRASVCCLVAYAIAVDVSVRQVHSVCVSHVAQGRPKAEGLFS